jgi:flagellar biosynthesis chaperone FliJ
MKRFAWPLQRLLDVTEQRERAQRAEMLALTREMARLRQDAIVHRAGVRALIAELGGMELAERLSRHVDFVRCCQAHDRQIEQLESRIAALTVQRQEMTRLLMKTRKSRETLERLREEARQEHLREQGKLEQAQFDETAHTAKARSMIAARAEADGEDS